MGEHSKIQWTDHTWNPWIGCTKVSAGCTNCYAEELDSRCSYTPSGWGKGKPRHRTSESNWKKPYTWNRKAVKTGTHPKVFCGSLMDFFDPEIPPEWRIDALEIVATTQALNWLILTKRPENIQPMLLKFFGPTGEQQSDQVKTARIFSYFKNVWIGVSVEDQATADERLPILCSLPMARKFISAEPLLEEINIFPPIAPNVGIGSALKPSWLIVGGENGPREMNPQWAVSLKEQSRLLDMKFFMKQMGTVWANQYKGDLDPGYKGDNPLCWLEELRLQEFPKGLEGE